MPSFFIKFSWFIIVLCWDTHLVTMAKDPVIYEVPCKCMTKLCPVPDSLEWRRLEEKCCPLGLTLHCQADDVGVYKVYCMKPVECPAGHFLRLGAITKERQKMDTLCQPCPVAEFQPAPIPSHYFTSTHCHNIHTLCSSPQKLTVGAGNTTSDNMCKCNYLKGYRPVPMADYDCKVFESSSGCVCKLEPCPPTQMMHPTDYRCVYPTNELLDEMEKDVSEASALFWQSSNILMKRQKLLLDISELMKQEGRDQCERLFVPFGELPCCENVKKQNPVMWMPVFPPPLHEDISADSFSDYTGAILYVIVVAGVILFAVFVARFILNRRVKKMQEPHTYIRLAISTKKFMEMARKEIQNILPLLFRHYGRLIVSVNQKKRHITIVVKQGQDEKPFPLRAFLRDLLSPVSMKDISYEKEADALVKVFILTGRSADLKEIERGFSSAVFSKSTTLSTGQMTLSFPDKKTEGNLILRLRQSRNEMKETFMKYNILLEDIREGSIKFMFRLANRSDTLDELAHDQQIIKITQDMFSHEGFQEMACGQTVSAEFTCNLKMEKISVLTANTLFVQIGEHNKVKVATHLGYPSDDREDQEQQENSYVIVADDSVDAFATIESAVAFQVMPRQNRQQGRIPNNGDPATLKPSQIKIVVECENKRLASRLHREWSNVLHLLLNHHPGWRMSRYPRRILWEHTATGSVHRDQLMSFLCDLYAPERVKSLINNQSSHTKVYVDEELLQAEDTPQEVQEVQTSISVWQGLRTIICWMLMIVIVLWLMYFVYNFPWKDTESIHQDFAKSFLCLESPSQWEICEHVFIRQYFDFCEW